MQDDFGDQEAEDSKGRANDQMVKMKNEDCCEKFREEIKRALGGREELPDDWTTTTKVEVKRCKGGPIAYWPLGRRTVRGSPCLGHSIWKAEPIPLLPLPFLP